MHARAASTAAHGTLVGAKMPVGRRALEACRARAWWLGRCRDTWPSMVEVASIEPPPPSPDLAPHRCLQAEGDESNSGCDIENSILKWSIGMPVSLSVCLTGLAVSGRQRRILAGSMWNSFTSAAQTGYIETHNGGKLMPLSCPLGISIFLSQEPVPSPHRSAISTELSALGLSRSSAWDLHSICNNRPL